MGFINDPKYYEKERDRYKRKFLSFKSELRNVSAVDKVLGAKNLSSEDLTSLLSTNSNDLANLVAEIARKSLTARGNMNSIWYSGIVSELLNKIGVSYTVHIGFALPDKVNPDVYADYTVANYMYIESSNGVCYHCFNGIINVNRITVIKDEILSI